VAFHLKACAISLNITIYFIINHNDNKSKRASKKRGKIMVYPLAKALILLYNKKTAIANKRRVKYGKICG
jgi:hypothetical protein